MSDQLPELQQAIRDAVVTHHPDAQLALDGVLVIQLMEADNLAPTLAVIEIGDAAPYTLEGWMAAAQRRIQTATDAQWE